MNILDELKDGLDWVDEKVPSVPALIGGIVIGALIPFKLIVFAAIAIAVWAAVKFIEFK